MTAGADNRSSRLMRNPDTDRDTDIFSPQLCFYCGPECIQFRLSARHRIRRIQTVLLPSLARFDLASWIACQTRTGVAGISTWSTPYGLSASAIALTIT